ncbi:zinc-binding dehydrogenase [Kitasatospora sp. NBC_00240]|uniref:quinone oxidoreductase family protein n=1 Tax=Kitasatospora sp. NBC_00240 TaxID=2903567 RepID=UPI00225B3953|nr:zinc-binding dehydrogenase [Kitasatospora sp. NBC_00240]MCX5209189.1 zinc-binding dehydrogenase [Kitasatospora sp. NBC_00240]
MRELRFHAYGGPAALRLDEVAEPAAGPGELLVRPDLAGVTLPALRQLRAPGAPQAPAGLGGEYLGRVVAVGEGVTGFTPGDRVGGIAPSVHADLVAAPAALAVAVPGEPAAGDALAVLRSGLVALGALRVGGLRPGESVLVTAAAGGVGHLAVQLAGALGAGRVTAAVGAEGKAAFVRGLGADEVVRYQDGPWGEQVDLVLDGVGGEVLPRAVGALAPFGRLVALGGAGGALDAGELLRGMRTVTGLSMAVLARQRPALLAEWRQELWALLGRGALRPVCVEFPIAAAAEAFGLLERRANLGKVALRIS